MTASHLRVLKPLSVLLVLKLQWPSSCKMFQPTQFTTPIKAETIMLAIITMKRTNTYFPVILFFMMPMLTGERVSGMSGFFDFCLTGLKSFLLCFWKQNNIRVKNLGKSFKYCTSMFSTERRHLHRARLTLVIVLKACDCYSASFLCSKTFINSLLVIPAKPISNVFFIHIWDVNF